ncbi:MAG: hypothetical protein V7785_13320 [Bermanella sp.]
MNKLKTSVSAIASTLLPSFALAHTGHGEHVLEVLAEPVYISVQAVVASLVVASVIVLAVKKFKSKS